MLKSLRVSEQTYLLMYNCLAVECEQINHIRQLKSILTEMVGLVQLYGCRVLDKLNMSDSLRAS